MSEVRLIDANALKEEVNKKKVVGRFNTLLLIDNAPTVEIPVARWDCYCEGQKVGYEKALSEKPTINCKDCDGYEAGYSAGLKDAERPQSECEKCPYKHTEKCDVCINRLGNMRKGGAV